MTLVLNVLLVCIPSLFSSSASEHVRTICSECDQLTYGSLTVCMYHHRLIRFGRCQHLACIIPASAEGQQFCLNHGGKRAPLAPSNTAATGPPPTTPIAPSPAPPSPQKKPRHRLVWGRAPFISSLGVIPEEEAVDLPMPVRVKRSAAAANLSDLEPKRVNNSDALP